MRGRIRTIKPEALSDEDLWDAEQDTCLPLFRAFVGLWCFADREGRFEWRPRALKAGVLPFWEGDFSRVLDALTTRGFLVRYACGTREYGLVRTFSKHQVINAREAPSEIPGPEDSTAESVEDTDTLTRAPRVPHACPTRHVHAHGEGKGREGKGTEGREERRVGDASLARSLASSEAPESGHPDTATGLLLRGYQTRYESETGDAWQGHSAAATHIDTVARWVTRQAELEGEPTDALVSRYLDRVFGNQRLRKARWPWKVLAIDPARDYAPDAAEDAATAEELKAKLKPQIEALETKLRMRRSLEGPDAGNELVVQIDALRAQLRPRPGRRRKHQ